jgi:fermentation-respiration switch protein FrsA (DUF1100 family)
MNRDLFLAILSLDSYNRGYGVRVRGLLDTIGTKLGNATVSAKVSSEPADAPFKAGFYALSYSYQGETIISYRGTDGLNDVLNGWTVGAGWTDVVQSNLSVEFYKAATGRDVFSPTIPTNITLTGHSLGGGLAGFVSMLSGAKAVMFDHMPFGRAATDTYSVALEALGLR